MDSETFGVFLMQIFCVKCNRHAMEENPGVTMPYPGLITVGCKLCSTTRVITVHDMQISEYKQFSLVHPWDRLAVGFTRKS